MSLELARACAEALSTLKSLAGEAPTPAQLETLRGWSGWGPLAPALDWRKPPSGSWEHLRREVKPLLTPDEQRVAAEVTATAFYTSPAVVAEMWRLATLLGFNGGRVLEPGCGAGLFIDGAPAGLPVEFTGVEIDPVTAAVARLLHPDHTIINAPLEETPLRNGAFDLAIGNVPFSNASPFDPSWPTEAGPDPSLHNYFLWRAVEAVRPGGLIMLVTSRYTMDAYSGQWLRAHLAEKASFVAAIRLPTGAFNEQGTKVVADIVVLRRHTGDEHAPEADADLWRESRTRADWDTSLNTYWGTHPHLCLGEMHPKSGQYGHVIDVVTPDGADPAELLRGAVHTVAADAHARGLAFVPSADGSTDAEPVVDTAPTAREGAHTLHPDGTVTRIEDGEPVKVRATAELKQLILLRDAALELFDAEGDASTPDDVITPLRDHCRALYLQYVKRFGPLNRSALRNGTPDPETGLPTIQRVAPSLGGFRADPDWPTTSAVEDWDDDTEHARPAQILLKRVNRPVARKTTADTPAEAIALTRDALGRFDLTYAADLLGCSTLTEAADRLAGLVFQDPATLEWEEAGEYLSGDVRAKLALARGAAEQDPGRWGANVVALEGVQPRDLGPAEINAALGSPWIPADVIQEFIAATFGVPVEGVTVRHEPFTASWEVTAQAARSRLKAQTTLGTQRINAIDLIQHALNNSSPVVYDRYKIPDPDKPGKEKTISVRNAEETLLAEDRQQQLNTAFVGWLWRSPGRTDRLLKLYNEQFNCWRLRTFDGSGYTFPGLAAWFTPYDHQLSMIARIIETKNAATLCGFGVGAGKTAIMVISAMKMKEMGLVSKPLIIVPNHLLEQVAGDARRLYPGARILMVTKKDLTKTRRKAFAAKVAANDWDVIVMTHTQFQMVPVSPGVEAEHVADLIDEYLDAMCGFGGDRDECRAIKRIGKQITKLRARHAKLLTAARDDGVFFDRLGIDFLFIDEAHYFKNLAAPTRADGFRMPGSKRAEDLHLKLGWLRRNSRHGRVAALFTGTPLTNTLAEAYTLLRYLAPDLLREKGLRSFDAFAGMFIEYKTSIEVTPDGSGFRSYRRPSHFNNVPDMRALLGLVSDIRSRRRLNLKGPKVVRKRVEVAAPPELPDIIADLVRRADAIRNGKVRPGKGEDNMLAICNEGRLAALDVRLLGITPTAPGKVEAVAENVARVYHATRNQLYPPLSDDEGVLWMERPGGFQMVFCDLGTPHTRRGDQAYGWMKQAMVARGVPADQIRYIHQAASDADRKALFAACRDGRVSVLIASTEKAATGVNVQHRLVAIHHADITWRPDGMEQRDGRGDRPGNCNHTLRIYQYVTIGSFDPYMLQTLERKQRMIDQVIDGDPSIRTVVDIPSETEQYYALLKAVSTGQERVLELEQLKADVIRLQNQAVAHDRDQMAMRQEADRLRRDAWAARRDAGYMQAVANRASGRPAVLRMHERKPVVDRDEAAAVLREQARDALGDKCERLVGTWRGVVVKVHPSWYEGMIAEIAFTLYGADNTSHGGWYHQARSDVLKGSNPTLLLDLIDAAIDGAETAAAESLERADRLDAQVQEAAGIVVSSFPHQAELEAAIKARDALQAEIQAEVDRKHTERIPDGAVPLAA